ncbi:MAG: hypothetical protein LBQ14_07420 [Treponema sp.]|nr:hypothetical protein [Treponema sp.]
MKTIAIRICLAIMLFFMVSIFIRFGTKYILIGKLYLDNWFTRAVFFDRTDVFFVSSSNRTRDIDWEKLYPPSFPVDNDVLFSKNIIKLPEKIKNKILSIEANVEEYTNDYLIGRMQLVEYAVKYEITMDWNLHESVIDLGDGWLAEPIEEVNINPFAASISEFNDYLKGLKIDFLYVQCPYNICKYDNIVSDFSNKNADNLLRMLARSRVPSLDLREHIHKENLNYHDLFYRTEPHWKIETGLWAAKILGRYLRMYNAFDLDDKIFDFDQYRLDVYENWFLGAMGRKITLARTQPEDFTLIYPAFQTKLSLSIPTRNIDKQGTFDIFYNYNRIKTKDYYHVSPYGAFCYERNPLVIINNELIINGKKILCLVDSFGRIAVPFLALGIESVEMIDFRMFDGSIKTFIEQSNPDMVIVLYNPNILTKESFDILFNFN